MATIAAKKDEGKLYNFTWEGKDKTGRMVRGEMRAHLAPVSNFSPI